MAKATVTIRLTPNELQFVRVALTCYVANIKAAMKRGGGYPDLTPAENEPQRAILAANKLLEDIGMK